MTTETSLPRGIRLPQEQPPVLVGPYPPMGASIDDPIEVGVGGPPRVSAPTETLPVEQTVADEEQVPCGKGESEVPHFVFAVGRVEPRFPSLGVEKEFAQATGRASTNGLSDRQAMQSVLADRSNRYLVRQLVWVLTIEGLETYLLTPRDPADFELLVDAVRPTPRLDDVDVVIGRRGPLAPPEMANGLTIPIVAFDQIFSFDVDALIESIPRPETISPEEFGPAAEDLFSRLIQIADNAGDADEHRALNYLAVRYPAIYERTAGAFAEEKTLASVQAQKSRLSGARNITDVVLTFRHRTTAVAESWFARVDVTEEFPFLVSALSPYYDRY